ncbi:hypothetical protein [Paraliomyxa miuraensis]|uniref:hypothetical protein n=1 Tax=Paraliomyxa miuraensis TaxID=376150 RepID=UPI0022599AF7|nr:hypothetical protein [Paraliomyxa miuraensis]MCX4246714.1 hypothetical protein [Paraliomyxa miuraensis]
MTAAALASAPFLLTACPGDDVVVGSGTMSGGSTSTTTTGEDTLPSDTTGPMTGVVDTTGTSSTGLDTTATEGDTSTGEPPLLPGQTQSQLVSSGRVMSSRGYSMVYTLGQPTALQSTHVSSNYTLQGGLVGANGSPP